MTAGTLRIYLDSGENGTKEKHQAIRDACYGFLTTQYGHILEEIKGSIIQNQSFTPFWVIDLGKLQLSRQLQGYQAPGIPGNVLGGNLIQAKE